MITETLFKNIMTFLYDIKTKFPKLLWYITKNMLVKLPFFYA